MSSNTCEMQAGCTLSSPATCSGTPTVCEALTATTCLQQPGCRLASGGTSVVKPTGILQSAPDLIFDTFTVRRSTSSGKDVLTLNFVERNRGNVAAAVHKNKLYLSANNTVGDADDFFLYGLDTNFILPPYGLDGASLATNLTMPTATELTPGYYYVIGVLDSGKQIAELEKENNVVVLPAVYVGPNRFDLQAVALQQTVAKALAPADTFDLSLTVKNGSTTTVPTAVVAAYFSTDQTVNTGDIAVDCTSSLALALATDATGVFTLNCKAPRARGTYYVLTEIDPKDTLGDADRTNNVAVAVGSVTVTAPSPDLTISALASDIYNLKWMGSVTLSATVANTGVDPAPTSSVDFIVNGTVLCSVTVPALAAGATAPVSKTCTLGNATIGSVSLSAKVDATDVIYETSESNNSTDSPTPLTVAKPDINLVAAGVGIVAGGASRKVGQALDVYYQLQNTGNDAAPPFRFIIYASTDSSITKDDTEFCIRDITSGMTPKSTTNDGLFTTCTVVTLPIGEYYLGMIVDTAAAIPETSETDNTTVDTLNKLTITK